jgi:hypothetical protein
LNISSDIIVTLMVLTAMGKPQLIVRVPPSLLNDLNGYVETTGISKTDVVVSAISQYLGSVENVPLILRMAELEIKMAELESLVKTN